MTEKVQIGFEGQAIHLGLDKLLPTRSVQPEVRKTRKFAQILSSIREIGLIEPLIVTPADLASGLHMLLDGHLRLLAMRDLGLAMATCLLSRDDEGYTYNKRVNRLATVQEHYMVLRALERGVPEDRLAKALDINIASLRRKRDLLDGICPEVEEMLKDRNFSSEVMRHLRKMKPQRQIECTDLMCSMNNFSVNYAAALLAATPADQLVESSQAKNFKGLSSAEISRMEQEMSLVQSRFKVIEQSYSNDVLNMVLARGYLNKLVSNKAVASYLQRRQPDLLEEFRSIVKITSIEDDANVSKVA
ncbi:MAG: ParB N-terminal domain-containing protein [Alphaproteobacteria bacterium]|nr:ParB N-terminal domain-containing protein [Alphaproteobacteria bacterium]